jgi:thioester reductase-like protein
MENPPLAIVGMACHFPGHSDNHNDYWKLLTQGRSGIKQVPDTRWDWKRYTHPDKDVPGHIVSQYGGFIEGVTLFDAAFFDMSPREAAQVDPQQRLLLQTTREALEDGGIAPQTLRGDPVGVFIGISSNDYGSGNRGSLMDIDIHTGTGNTFSIAANRLSYYFDLRGPSVAVDTACSSALVATSLACQSIWSGESTMALAGGVNLILSAISSVTVNRMLSPDGQCFTFDQRANGYVRGEGAGIVVIKPLEDAIRDGDHIYAAIRRAVINQDGRTSSITVPNLNAQQAMLQEAYAGLDANNVVYMEAHGTGTPIGDPIETRAIGSVVGVGRQAPCLIGSAKTNIGHLEAASGVAGLIKGALVLHHGQIPPQLNYQTPNPNIPFADLNLQVVTELTPLPNDTQSRPIVGVNSFGFGGTNAHIVLEQYHPPEITPVEGPAERPYVLPFSANAPQALREQANNYLDHLNHPLAEFTTAAGLRRDHLPYRHAVIGYTQRELRNGLRHFLNDPTQAHTHHTPADPAFVFSGQGAQWWGMGQQLFQREPIFRQAVEEVDSLFEPISGWSIGDEMMRSEADSRVDDTAYAQPLLFALQVGLVALWRTWGITPSVIVGHSIGEVAGIYTAGILSLDDAVRVVYHRSTLQNTTRGQGTMAAIGLPEADVAPLLGDDVEIAGVNSPRLTVIAGDGKRVRAIVEELEQDGIFTRLLPIDYAFHTYQMDPLRDDLLRSLADIQPREGHTPYVSTVTGEPLTGPEVTAAYWWQNLRQPVAFAPAIQTIAEMDIAGAYLELGPHSSFQYAIRDTIGGETPIHYSLYRDSDESETMLENLIHLYYDGYPIDWQAVNQGTGRCVRLPAYPWQKTHYVMHSVIRDREDITPLDHPLLGVPQHTHLDTWRHTFDPRVLSYLADHQILGGILLPAAAYAEMLIAVARQMDKVIEDMELVQGLFLSAEKIPLIDVTVTDAMVTISSSPDAGISWVQHATATLRTAGAKQPAPVDIEALQARLEWQDYNTHYRQVIEDLGYHFGPSFQLIKEAWNGPRHVLGRVDGSEVLDLEGYHAHPALLDAGLQGVLLFKNLKDAVPDGGIYLPKGIGRMQLFVEQLPAQFWYYSELLDINPQTILTNTLFIDDEGQPLAQLLNTEFEFVESQKHTDMIYHFEWEPRRLKEWPIHTPFTAADPDALLAAAVDDPSLPAESTAFSEAPLQKLAVEASLHTLLKLGWRYPVGSTVTLDDIMQDLGIVERHRPLAHYLLNETDRLTAVGPTAWRIEQAFDLDDYDSLIERMTHYDIDLNIELIIQAIQQQAALFRGLADPLEVMFPGGATAPVRKMYRDPVFSRTYDIIRNILTELDHPLRVLEVGAGTGALTETILPDLPLDYTFSDVSQKFLNEAQQRFTDHPHVGYQLVDISRPIQGYYDVILASNAIHTVDDPLHSLTLLREALAPGGLLIMTELQPDILLGSFIFGIHQEWWQWDEDAGHYTIALRTAEEWHHLFAEAGFATSASPQHGDHIVLVAQAPVEQEITPPLLTGQYLVMGDLPELITQLPDDALLDDVADITDPQATTVICIEPDLMTLLELAQTVTAERLIIVARDVYHVVEGDTVSGVEHTSLIGMLRVIRNELSYDGWQLVDLGEEGTVEHLLAELTVWDGEPEVAYRNGKRHVIRLHHTDVTAVPQHLITTDAYGLFNEHPGALANMRLTAIPRPTLAPHEVEVRVAAAGINFRDVMKVLGIYPGTPEELAAIGDDFAGTVVAVGDDVQGFQVGDEVFGIAPHTFKSIIKRDYRYVMHKPPTITFEEAAGSPTVFMTAYQCLVNLARLQRGDRVLIHAATGGVGQAAVQIAKDVGAEIFATAGTPEKRELLRSQGIEHVFHSRTLDFADDILAVTDGVDVILNSLAGDFIPKNLSVLAPLGRYVEIGKIDIYANQLLGMAALKHGISFHVFDLPLFVETRPHEALALNQTLYTKFKEGTYQPITTTSHDISDAVETFRTIAAGQHIGKNVFRMTDHQSVARSESAGSLFRPDASYLITGGASGFGLATARWMVEQGARHLTLMTRSGPRDDASRQIIEEMQQAGATIVDARGDVLNTDDIQGVVDAIEPPLAGVFHAAFVLSDAFLKEMDEETFRKGYDIKAIGARNLHHATAHLDLDYFVLYSSASSVWGNLRQASYNAANTYTEGLIAFRRAQGLAGSVINWGGISDTGAIAENQKMLSFLQANGIPPMRSTIALKQLGKVLPLDHPQFLIWEVDWDVIKAALSDSPMMEYVIKRGEAGAQGELTARVLAAPAGERLALVEKFLITTAANILNMEPDRIDPTAGFSTFGLDSMMAVEMTNVINRQLESSIPISDMITRTNLTDLAELVLRYIEQAGGGDGASTVNLWSEVTLAPDIHGGQGNLVETPRHAFLTGATGFLGGYLLYELLTTTDMDVSCLVRATDENAAMQRIEDNLRTYNLWQEDFASRIVPLVGDLAEPQLGLTDETFEWLTREADAIYHNGAELHLTKPYADLKATNVDSVRHILRLASQDHVKPVHFVSTAAIFLSVSHTSDEPITERSEASPETLINGYTQSKWVAEQIVQLANQRGIPCTIYRPGSVTGDSRTGQCNVDDITARIIKGSLQIQSYAESELSFNIVPVDYMSKALVYISRQADVGGQIFHLTSPQMTRFQDIVEWGAHISHSLNKVSYTEWRQALQTEATNAMAPLIMLFPPTEPERIIAPIGCDNTLNALEGTGIVCPPIDQALLHTYEAYLFNSGFIEAQPSR